jgi:hypothetical protein
MFSQGIGYNQVYGGGFGNLTRTVKNINNDSIDPITGFYSIINSDKNKLLVVDHPVILEFKNQFQLSDTIEIILHHNVNIRCVDGLKLSNGIVEIGQNTVFNRGTKIIATYVSQNTFECKFLPAMDFNWFIGYLNQNNTSAISFVNSETGNVGVGNIESYRMSKGVYKLILPQDYLYDLHFGLFITNNNFYDPLNKRLYIINTAVYGGNEFEITTGYVDMNDFSFNYSDDILGSRDHLLYINGTRW